MRFSPWGINTITKLIVNFLLAHLLTSSEIKKNKTNYIQCIASFQRFL